MSTSNNKEPELLDISLLNECMSAKFSTKKKNKSGIENEKNSKFMQTEYIPNFNDNTELNSMSDLSEVN